MNHGLNGEDISPWGTPATGQTGAPLATGAGLPPAYGAGAPALGGSPFTPAPSYTPPTYTSPSYAPPAASHHVSIPVPSGTPVHYAHPSQVPTVPSNQQAGHLSFQQVYYPPSHGRSTGRFPAKTFLAGFAAVVVFFGKGCVSDGIELINQKTSEPQKSGTSFISAAKKTIEAELADLGIGIDSNGLKPIEAAPPASQIHAHNPSGKKHHNQLKSTY